jgi:hypothetical protein
MSYAKFDYTKQDAMAMPVTPMDPAHFDLARYEAFAAEADRRYAVNFSAGARASPSGSAFVWAKCSATPAAT